MKGKRGKVPQDDFVVSGVRRTPLRDLYHLVLRASWPALLAGLVAFVLVSNALFALLYVEVGGIANAQPGNFTDAFFFSIQTMATIGYGAMYPQTVAAHVVVAVEAIVGLSVTALSTGLVFTRFSQPRAEVVFASRLCISPVDGKPSLQCRLGNDRDDVLVEAQFHVDVFRTTVTKEGKTIYRGTELQLVKQRASTLSRTWTLMHVIDEQSPLFGLTPESAAKVELEVHLSVVAIDDTTNQTVHARARYATEEIVWGARPGDVLFPRPDGKLTLALERFDEIEPTPPTPTFPHEWRPRS
ncbi:MAG: ATP-sensitive inward rectifier potassium channel 10 [Archangiaceae bacterium]|nr:ATP-sensitive inward rectifier potassium channel 10 [Archangiaceae bacterium]